MLETLPNKKINQQKNANSISTANPSELYTVDQFQSNTSIKAFLSQETKDRINETQSEAMLNYILSNFACGTGGHVLADKISLPCITINTLFTCNVVVYQNKTPEIKITEKETAEKVSEPVYDIGEILSVIRASLSFNMTEMAQVIQVERQTIYSWMGGTSEPNPSNRKRINYIFQIAQYWKNLSSQPVGELVRQSYMNGENLVAMLSKENINNIEQVFAFLEKISETVFKETSNKENIRERAARKGLKIKENTEAIDWLTGKRINLEEQV